MKEQEYWTPKQKHLFTLTSKLHVTIQKLLICLTAKTKGQYKFY